MPAKSEKQKKFFQLVLAYKEGEVGKDEVSQDVIDTAEDMSTEEIEDFATGPVEETVSESKLREIVRQELREAGLRHGRGFRGKGEDKELERLERLRDKTEEAGYDTFLDTDEPRLMVMDDSRNELEVTTPRTHGAWRGAASEGASATRASTGAATNT